MQDQTDQAFVEPHQFSAIHQFSAHSKVFCLYLVVISIPRHKALNTNLHGR